MTVALSYLSDLGRVRITGSDITGTTVLVERSTDQVRWQVVRGGLEVELVDGGFTLDDYEFVTDVENFYRVSVTATDPIEFIAVGTAVGNGGGTGSLSPTIPEDAEAGDLLVLVATMRNIPVGSGYPTVTTPGWSLIADGQNVRVYARIMEEGDTGATVTFAGGQLNQDKICQIAAFRGADVAGAQWDQVLTVGGVANAIPYPSLVPNIDDMLTVVLGWKADDLSSAALSGFTEIDAIVNSTAGNDASISWWYDVQAAKETIPAGSIVTTGGSAQTSRGMTLAFRPVLTSESDSITVQLDSVWLKSIARPFLNVPVRVVGRSPVTRRSRSGVWDIEGRSLPVEVSSLRGGREYTMTVRMSSRTDADNFDTILASGDTLFIQVPQSADFDYLWMPPGVYAAVGDTSQMRYILNPLSDFMLPLREVAAPDASIVGATNTWQGVINTYASWDDVLADTTNADDWLALQSQIGSLGDVIVE